MYKFYWRESSRRLEAISNTISFISSVTERLPRIYLNPIDEESLFIDISSGEFKMFEKDLKGSYFEHLLGVTHAMAVTDKVELEVCERLIFNEELDLLIVNDNGFLDSEKISYIELRKRGRLPLSVYSRLGVSNLDKAVILSDILYFESALELVDSDGDIVPVDSVKTNKIYKNMLDTIELSCHIR